jgi:uncharacterized membrane protein
MNCNLLFFSGIQLTPTISCEPTTDPANTMILLAILFGSLLFFRLLGFAGVSAFSTWHESLAFGFAALFCFTGVAHFARQRVDLEKMVPPWIPYTRQVVFVTGILEILGAIGLLIPTTRWLAGVCLIGLLVAIFPANVHASMTGVTINNRPLTQIWIRTPIQILLIILLFWLIHS